MGETSPKGDMKVIAKKLMVMVSSDLRADVQFRDVKREIKKMKEI